MVGVDSSTTDETEDICVRLADKVVRLDPLGTSEAGLGWLNKQCEGDWILRLDHDELPSEALINLLPRLLADREVTHYHFPRRWVVGRNADRWIAEPPWWPDWQTRLFRNIGSIVHIPGRLHSDYVVAGCGARCADAIIYHYDLVFHDEERRRRKLEQYEAIAPGKSLRHYYFPDEANLVTRPLDASLPPPDPPRPLFDLPRRTPVHVTRAEMRRVAREPCAQALEQCGAIVSDQDALPALRASTTYAVRITLANSGACSWTGHCRGADPVRLSYHWYFSDGEIYEWDGIRTELPRSVEPGEEVTLLADVRSPRLAGQYYLEWDLVIEGVTWFSQQTTVCPRIPVTITGLEVGDRRIEAYLRASENVPGWLRGEEAVAMVAEIASLPNEPVVVEVGSFLGSGSIVLAGSLMIRGTGELHCIDPFDGSGDSFSVPVYEDLVRTNCGARSMRDCFEENLAAAGVAERVRIYQARAEEAACGWSTPIDLLFLDGDQSPEGATRGYESLFPFVKQGGVIAIHNSGPRDYAPGHDGARLLAVQLASTSSVEFLQRVDSITFFRKLEGGEVERVSNSAVAI